MEKTQAEKTMRELIRNMERKLGLLDDLQMSCCQMSFAQCHALVEIGRAQSLSLNELARLLELDKSTMSRTIDQLVKDGQAVREADPHDRRFISIRLTSTGLRMFRKIESDMEQYFERWLHAIPEKERKQIIESLQSLIAAMPEKSRCDSKGNCRTKPLKFK